MSAVVIAWRRDLASALVIGGAIAASMVAACLYGVLLPTLLRAFKADPRIASGPLVLASADVTTLVVYLGLGARLGSEPENPSLSYPGNACRELLLVDDPPAARGEGAQREAANLHAAQAGDLVARRGAQSAHLAILPFGQRHHQVRLARRRLAEHDAMRVQRVASAPHARGELRELLVGDAATDGHQVDLRHRGARVGEPFTEARCRW